MEKLRSHSTRMAAVVMGYQSLTQASKPYGKHSLLSAHQRSSSPLTQSMMGFRKSHFPHTGNPLCFVSANSGCDECRFSKKGFLCDGKSASPLSFSPTLNPYGSFVRPSDPASCGNTTFNICFSSPGERWRFAT